MCNPCSLDVVLDEHAELLVVAHQGAADAASVLDTGPAQLARRVGEVADALRVALDVALFGGLSDAEHGLPPHGLPICGRASCPHLVLYL